MASSVEGDHRGAPFHASGLYYLPGRLRVYVSCLMGQHCVAAFLTMTCLFLVLVAVRRLAKEEISYKTEAKQQEEKVERLKAEAGDEYVIKKQVCATSFYPSL